MNTMEIIRDILVEVNRAKKKHPNSNMPLGDWVAVVSEESGELTRAYLQFKYEGKSVDEIKIEAIQTAATCIRLLEILNNNNKYIFKH